MISIFVEPYSLTGQINNNQRITRKWKSASVIGVKEKFMVHLIGRFHMTGGVRAGFLEKVKTELRMEFTRKGSRWGW